jgi:cytochrome c peroxidase
MESFQHGTARSTKGFAGCNVFVCLTVALLTAPVASDQGTPSAVRSRTSFAPAGDRVAELGERLFFDARLSRDGKVGCASCHRPEQADEKADLLEFLRSLSR